MLQNQAAMNKAALKSIRKLSQWHEKHTRDLAGSMRGSLLTYISEIRAKRAKPPKRCAPKKKTAEPIARESPAQEINI